MNTIQSMRRGEWCSGYITGKPRQRPSACVACRCSQGVDPKNFMFSLQGAKGFYDQLFITALLFLFFIRRSKTAAIVQNLVYIILEFYWTNVRRTISSCYRVRSCPSPEVLKSHLYEHFLCQRCWTRPGEVYVYEVRMLFFPSL